jgi:F-type H+-transporting ATPase subunit a
MSAIAAPAPTGSPVPSGNTEKQGMSKGRKIGLGVFAAWFLGLVFFVIVFGTKPHEAKEVASGVFTPINEFKLNTWFSVGPVDFNKGVLYVIIAAVITIWVMLYVAKRLKERPGRLQVAVEMFYNVTRGMARDNLDGRMSKKYFPLIATLFVFILVTNLIGYVPLPVNSEKFKIFGAHIPSFQIFAADTNLALPLMLALLVFVLFTWEGLKAHHGPIGFLKSLMPGGVKGGMVPLIFGIEILSYFLRLVSLSVRLWANLLAGHILIAFMGGELGVLVGDQWLQWLLLPLGIGIFLFEAVLIAGLQAFIFSILTAIYLGSAVRSH